MIGLKEFVKMVDIECFVVDEFGSGGGDDDFYFLCLFYLNCSLLRVFC